MKDTRVLAVLPSFDLSYLVPQIMRDHADLTQEQVEQCIEKYRNYLALCKTYPEHPLMPSHDVDLAWHQHILNTRRYHTDCAGYFGQYLHHNPRMPTTEVATRSHDLYAHHFGSDGKGIVMCGCSDGCDQSLDFPLMHSDRVNTALHA